MLWWVAQNLIIVAFLAAAVSLICRWKRLSPAARHALWLVVLVKLVTPPLFVWPWGIPVPTETLTEVVNVKQDLSRPEAIPFEEIEIFSSGMAESKVENFTMTDGLIVSSETFVVPLNTDAENKRKSAVAFTSVLPEIQSRMQAEQRSVRQFDRWIFWGSTIWITGIFVMAFWQGLRIWKMNRLVKNAQPAPEWLSRLLEETCVLLSIRAPQIVLVRGISTPLLWAWGRPMLLWPEELSEQLSPQAKQGVLLHELAHLKRKDHWVGRLELVAGCLWWPNPLFWYVRHQLRENAELACDAWVVQTLPNGRRDYADALLTVCQNYSHPAVPLPALGMGKSTRRTLERRLTMILRDRVPFRVSWWGMIAVLLLGFLTLPSWSQSKKETVQVPEAASKADIADTGAKATAGDAASDELAVPAAGVAVGDQLAEPVADVAAGGIKVQELTADGLRTIIIKQPLEKTVTTDRVVLQKDSDDEQGIYYEDTPNPARMRERRVYELEKEIQSLRRELQKLRGKKK
ncbi:MAG: M56 family metallopeptidase, partial [Planctomycetes bacterium]|nr:M56 family metallopeptidase [Planctomycetota bacterium]